MLYCYDKMTHILITTLRSIEEVMDAQQTGEVPFDADVVRTYEPDGAGVHALPPTVIGM